METRHPTVTHARMHSSTRVAVSRAMPAVDDETSDEEREEDRGAEERAAVACLLALRAATTRTSLDRVDDTVEAAARAARESHPTHRFDRCLTRAKTREIVRANGEFFPIPERRRRVVVERILARVRGARRRAAREGEKDTAARTPARTTPPMGSERTAPVDETVDVGVHASVIERVRTGVDATTIESPNSDDAKSDTTRGPTNELLDEEEEEEEEEEEIQCTQTQDPDTCLPEEIQCTQTYTDSRVLVQSSARDLIIIDGSDDERDEHAERENAADDDEDGSARKKPKLSHENYTMAQITSMVCSYAAEEGKDLEEIFSKIRSAAAESAREHIQRDRRRLEMHASRLDKNI